MLVEPRERRRCDRGDEQDREVRRRQLREQRCDEHTGEAGEEARQHPRERADPVRVDARELGHPRALDDRPHPQPDPGVAEQERQEDHRDDRGDHGGGLVAVDRVVTPAVDAELVRPDRRHPVERVVPDPELHDLGQRDEEAEGHDKLRHRGRRAEAAEEEPLEDEPDQGRRHEHRGQERRDVRPVALDAQLVVDRRRRERLRGEREVEHPRRLVRQHQPDRDQRERAPERDAPDDVAEKFGHGFGRASLGRIGLDSIRS